MSGKSLMHGQGESYHGVVPTKQPNKGGEPPAEVVEGRPWTKENTPQTNLLRTPSRESGTTGLERVRRGAPKAGRTSPPDVRFDANHYSIRGRNRVR